MIDLHLHILPGIDDGAEDLEEAAEMCRLALADGCTTLVATPHQRHASWWNTDRKALENLQRMVQQVVGPVPEIRLGAEIRIGSGLLDDLERLPDSGLLSLAGSRYLLLELDRYGIGPDPEPLVHELCLAGWLPVLAHPEFIPTLASDLGLIQRLTEVGALFQVTAMSVTGEVGKETTSFVHQLLDAGLAHFVASDAHGVGWRSPGLRAAHEAIARGWGEERAERLTTVNPQAVIDDRPLEAVDRQPTFAGPHQQ